MTVAITLLLAITLSGVPGTLACARLCGVESSPAGSAGTCHGHSSSTLSKSRITSGSEECATTPNVAPFLVERTLRSSTVVTVQPAVVNPATGHAAVLLADAGELTKRRATGPPLVQSPSAILRI